MFGCLGTCGVDRQAESRCGLQNIDGESCSPSHPKSFLLLCDFMPETNTVDISNSQPTLFDIAKMPDSKVACSFPSNELSVVLAHTTAKSLRGWGHLFSNHAPEPSCWQLCEVQRKQV